MIISKCYSNYTNLLIMIEKFYQNPSQTPNNSTRVVVSHSHSTSVATMAMNFPITDQINNPIADTVNNPLADPITDPIPIQYFGFVSV